MKRLFILFLITILMIPNIPVKAVESNQPVIQCVHVDDEIIESATYKAESSLQTNVTITTADYGFIRLQLSKNQSEIYDALSKYRITNENNGVLFYFQVSTQKDVDTIWTRFADNFELAMTAYIFDYPDTFYFNDADRFGIVGEVDEDILYIYLYYAVSEYYQPEYEIWANNVINNVVKNAKGTRLEKVTYFHDRIVDRTIYNEDVANDIGTDDDFYFGHNSSGCILEGSGVCDSYAKTLKIMHSIM